MVSSSSLSLPLEKQAFAAQSPPIREKKAVEAEFKAEYPPAFQSTRLRRSVG